MYRASIKDKKGSPITPIYRDGTAAQHFVACVELYLDNLNHGPWTKYIQNRHHQEGSATRSLISNLLPGGRADKKLMKQFNQTLEPLPFKEGAFVNFIASLHDHKEITPDNFLKKWGDNNIQELLYLPIDSTELIPLSIEFLKNAKIPGVGECKIEKIILQESSSSTSSILTSTRNIDVKESERKSDRPFNGIRAGFLNSTNRNNEQSASGSSSISTPLLVNTPVSSTMASNASLTTLSSPVIVEAKNTGESNRSFGGMKPGFLNSQKNKSVEQSASGSASIASSSGTASTTSKK